MNKQVVALLIPILALAIPVCAIIANSVLKLAKLRLEETRLRVQGGDAPPSEAVESLRQDLDAMRTELTELQERVDFAERLLARPPAPPPGP
jgi:hypothetical protein